MEQLLAVRRVIGDVDPEGDGVLPSARGVAHVVHPHVIVRAVENQGLGRAVKSRAVRDQSGSEVRAQVGHHERERVVVVHIVIEERVHRAAGCVGAHRHRDPVPVLGEPLSGGAVVRTRLHHAPVPEHRPYGVGVVREVPVFGVQGEVGVRDAEEQLDDVFRLVEPRFVVERGPHENLARMIRDGDRELVVITVAGRAVPFFELEQGLDQTQDGFVDGRVECARLVALQQPNVLSCTRVETDVRHSVNEIDHARGVLSVGGHRGRGRGVGLHDELGGFADANQTVDD